MNRIRHAWVGLVLFLVPTLVLSATFQVGPTHSYKSLKSVALASELEDGDIIEVDGAGDYCGDVATWKQDRLTIRGVGKTRPHLQACETAESGKGIWVVRGADFTVENIEFSGARVESLNGAAIRAEGGGTLLVRNCYFHHNDNGILGGGAPSQHPGKSAVIVEYSIFEENGAGDGKSHNLYISQRVDELIFRHNLSHLARTGHNLKSRAAKNIVAYNHFGDDSDGTASFQIDLPNGGLSYVIGNVIQQGPKAKNSTLLAYSNETSKTANPVQDLYVINNTFVNTRPEGATFVRINSSAGKSAFVLIRNNVFYGRGAPWTASDAVKVIQDYNHVGERLDNGPKFVSPEKFDFRLTPESPLIDKGWKPGSGRGYVLTPEFQYVDHAQTAVRRIVGRIDIGAFEFEGTHAGE